MENIFLDTSIFVKENFLQSKRIETILDLCKKNHFQLVLSIITVKEIKAQFRKRAKKAIEEHNNVINDKDNILMVLKNNAAAKDILKKFPFVNEVCDGFNNMLDMKLKEANAIILDYPVLNIGGVFDKYFKEQHPFNTNEKKHEFPDAFALAQLEQWCEETNTKCLIFSKDRDFLKYASKHFIIHKDYEKYIENFLKKIDPVRVELLSKLFIANGDYIDNEIKKWLKDQLDDDMLYTDHTNWLDVHDIVIEDINILDKTYEIVTLHDETIEIDITAEVQIKVILTIDDEDSGIYDSEDKVMMFVETTQLTIDDADVVVPLLASFYIVDKNEYDERCEVIEINEGKDLELKNNQRDYY